MIQINASCTIFIDEICTVGRARAERSGRSRRRLIYCFQFYIINDEQRTRMEERRKWKRGKKRERERWLEILYLAAWSRDGTNGSAVLWSTRVRDIYLKRETNVEIIRRTRTCSINKQIARESNPLWVFPVRFPRFYHSRFCSSRYFVIKPSMWYW